MTTNAHDIASRFLQWWSDPEARKHEKGLFHPDVTYEQTEGFEGDGAFWFVRQSPRWPDVVADVEVPSRDCVRIRGKGTDPITLLPHDLQWKLTIRDGAILSVIETVKIAVAAGDS